MTYSKKMYIGGTLLGGDVSADVTNPATGSVVGTVAVAGKKDVKHRTAHLRYGEVQINGVKYDIDLPHGGIGQSGMGHDCSHLALNDYLCIKRISRALAA
ncbi:MAG: aldehyde dehydrogenase family protein [Stappiaceae bacterium]